MRGKTKVSVTVRTDLLAQLRDAAGPMSRSAVFEQALAGWLRGHRQIELDRAIENYYVTLPASERAEDAAWARVGDATVQRTWPKPKR